MDLIELIWILENVFQEKCKSEDKVIDILKDPGPLLEMNGAPWNKIYKANLLKEQADLEHPPRILDDMMFFTTYLYKC